MHLPQALTVDFSKHVRESRRTMRNDWLEEKNTTFERLIVLASINFGRTLSKQIPYPQLSTSSPAVSKVLILTHCLNFYAEIEEDEI